MPGSSLSVADPNIVLNTAVAESLSKIYDKLKDVKPEDMSTAVTALVKEMLDAHKRILFNGNGYTDAWVAEAEKRGLYNLKSHPEATPRLIADKNVELFTKHGIFTKEELDSRYEIFLENYVKTIHIESLTMQEMVRKDFTCGIVSYMKDITNETLKKKQLMPSLDCSYEEKIIGTLDAAEAKICTAVEKLDEDTKTAEKIEDELKCATYYYKTILSDMAELRASVDKAEAIIPDSYLPYPTYGQMLFSLR